MARIAAAIVIVLAPCPRVHQMSAPIVTVATTVEGPRATSPVGISHTVRLAQTRRAAGTVKASRPVSSLSAARAAKVTHHASATKRRRVPARPAARHLTTRQFAASLPDPWPAIVRCESLNDGSWRASSRSYARGLFQFLRSSWRLVGGHGDPAAASLTEQWSRARMLLRLQGWGAWDCAQIVGVR